MFFSLQVMEKGGRFTLRSGSKTLGYGVITDILPEFDIDTYEAEKKKAKKAAAKAAAAEGYQASYVQLIHLCYEDESEVIYVSEQVGEEQW